MIWTEFVIARAIATQTLAKKCVVLVDNCNWTGAECDVLAVTRDLRIIDVEIKVSRRDFRIEAHKDKWWHRFGTAYNEATHRYEQPSPTPKEWPNKVWKHYMAMPADIWQDDMFQFMPSTKSGLLLFAEDGGRVTVKCRRRALPNTCALHLKTAAVMDIARLANLRMWDAYAARNAIAARSTS